MKSILLIAVGIFTIIISIGILVLHAAVKQAVFDERRMERGKFINAQRQFEYDRKKMNKPKKAR